MCFFTSLSANAAAVAKKYGKQLDIIEAARQILAEQEQEERARQEAGPEHKVSVYDIRLAEERQTPSNAMGADSTNGEA